MRKTAALNVYGVKYMAKQLAAADAFEWMTTPDDEESMMVILRSVSIDGVPLDSAAVVNDKVRDPINVMRPRLVLKELLRIVGKFNFGFLDERKQVKVPTYLKSDTEARLVEGESPIMGVLISENRASLRELEEYYSMEDAFRLYDIVFIDKLNAAEANHAAYKKRK